MTRATPPGRREAASDRRRFLKTGGVVAGALFAGCLGQQDAPLFDHAAAAGLRNEPRLGPSAAEAEAAIVVFEDPSCPVCRVFDEQTFPSVRSELVEPGRVAFFSRGYRAAAPWGLLGLKLLEGTYARDPAAFWDLRGFYFENQGRIVSDTLFDRTRAFLREDTGLDPEPLIRAATSGDHDDAVEADERAATDAGVRGTPTFFLFEDSEYLTKIEGAPSYDLLHNTLGIES